MRLKLSSAPLSLLSANLLLNQNLSNISNASWALLEDLYMFKDKFQGI